MISRRPIFAGPDDTEPVRTTGERSWFSGGMLMAIIWLVLLYTAGVYLFEYYEGWTALDAVYFVTVTVTTIGYGDLVPKTSEGKMLTIVIAWTGISVAFYLIYQFATYRDRWLDRHITYHLARKLGVFREFLHRKKRTKA